MSAWPRWSRQNAPGMLAAYVQRRVTPRLLPADQASRLPGPGEGPPLERARRIYELFAEREIRYVLEDPASEPGRQVIRPPDEVLRLRRHATCLDIAVTFAGTCLDAGLHPLIVLMDPAGAPGSAHALVVVWLGGNWEQPRGHADYPLHDVLHHAAPDAVIDDLCASERETGAFIAVDVTRAAHGYLDGSPRSWADALAAGAKMVTGEQWAWGLGVDVGLDSRDPLPMPRWPTMEPLTPPYQPTPGAGPLAQISARYGKIPFYARDDLDLLMDWCEAPGPAAETRIAIVHGLGGAGKTHLAAELAARMAKAGWYTGFLLRNPADDQLEWLARVAAPVLVVVDYAEAAKTTQIIDLLRVVHERELPICVVLTARAVGDWWNEVARETARDGVRYSLLDRLLEPAHPRTTGVFRATLRAFAPEKNAYAPLPEAPRPVTWTTLDLVLLGWLAAHGDPDLPAEPAEIYERVLDHEFSYWRDTWDKEFGLKPSPKTLRSIGAGISLVAPNEDRVPNLLEKIFGIQNQVERDKVADLLSHLLPTSREDGSITIHPDPVSGHLIVTAMSKDKGLFAASVTNSTATELANICDAISRAEQNDRQKAVELARAALDIRSDMWPQALMLTLAKGGPFVTALEELAEADDTPLPLQDLAELIPVGHSTLRGLALIATQHIASPSESDAIQEMAERANWLNNLSNRQSDTGDRAGALASIEEAVQIRRTLADANPAAFLPDLAGSLNNLSNQQANTGDRAGALASIEEATSLYRTLADANPAAFLPNLATSLNNLSNQQANTGDRAGALASIEEATSLYRTLA
ncbi:tetratricopeptide repeat protein, partial [Actinomadura rayongensis]